MNYIQKKNQITNSIDNIKFVKPEALYPHEQVTKNINNILKDIQQTGFINNPINCLNLNNRLIVLDGHHRLKSLIDLNCKLVPIQIVGKSEIKLDYWYHALDNANFEKILNYINKHNRSTTAQRSGISIGIGNSRKQITVDKSQFFSFVLTIFNMYKESEFHREDLIKDKTQWICYEGITLDDIYINSINHQLFPSNVTKFGGFNKMEGLKIPLSILQRPSDLEIREFLDELEL
ncbi:ParB-like nuclease domain-containing protein [Gracilibacillus orientalis]|uniref:ParB-like nuclease domain-containing protein n=1 Tax=Gracilibacillus orientalis TaxID=334253 RepID=A0A1I4H5G3_9BACI|nr:ParB N-terminal domain-containing protein [Gracilibacillus orientalis]SFL37415.1 ParB-like nuclease domain-containing protein [Gracilibacillus orientalis]